MIDVRQELFWHPVHGDVKRAEQKDIYIRKDLLKVVITEPMETVYERDRRLWAESLLIRKIARFGLPVGSFDTERWTASAMALYDKIQSTNFSLNQ